MCRALLSSDSAPECPPASPPLEPVVTDMELVPTAVCPQCGKGRMVVVEELPPTLIGPWGLKQSGEQSRV